jgi:predicted cupin superfamily sugar epimerase
MQTDVAVKQWIERLELHPHPEGGFYRETYRHALLTGEAHHQRNLATAIYFLIPGKLVTGWHAVASDEMWHFYAGEPVVLERISHEGHFHRHLLGIDIAAGQQPQVLIPKHEWQRAYSLGNFSLCGCTVSPGFDFRDFELISSEKLANRYPHIARYITRNPFQEQSA